MGQKKGSLRDLNVLKKQPEVQRNFVMAVWIRRMTVTVRHETLGNYSEENNSTVVV
jgi:hypothetical protein